MKLLLTTAALAAMLALAPNSDARPFVRHTHGVFTGARGYTVTEDGTLTRSRGFRERDTTWTGENGRTREVDATKQRTGDHDVSYNRDTTFADGSTRDVSRDRDGNGDGTGTVTRTVTGRNGDTRTQTGTYDITH